MPVSLLSDPDMPLSELISRWPQTIHVFLRYNMLCVGCLIGPFHTLVDACDAYQLDLDAFIDELIAAVGS